MVLPRVARAVRLQVAFSGNVCAHARVWCAGVCVVKWPTEKKTDANPIYCVVTVFGLAF
jgi:hypothetical protein